jgi:hypothetical protein
MTPVLGARDLSIDALEAQSCEPFPPRHVNATAFQSSRCLPPERTFANTLSSARRGALPPLASVGSRRTCSSTFENLD